MLKQRTKNAIVGSISIIVSRFFSIGIGLVLTSMVARYFSPEKFGLWAILTFLIGIVPVLDIGIGLALRNKLSILYSEKNNNSEEGKAYFFSVFYFYIFVVLILSSFLYFAKSIIPWESLFNTTNPQIIREGAFSFTLSLIILIISLPFTLSMVGLFSYQETHWNSFFELIKSILAILFIVPLIIFHASFIVIVCLFSLAMLLPVVISFFVFLKRRRWRPIIVSVKTLTSKIKELISKGVQFGLMQISATLMFSTQALIVGKVSGLKDAGEYALVQKLFLILNILQFAVLTPLWSAYTEAIISRDISWVKKSLMYSVIFSVTLFTIGSVGLYIFGKPMIHLWTGKTITNTSLYAFMGVWIFITGWVNCFSVYLNGIGKLKVQTMLIVPAAITYIPLGLYFSGKIGIVGICLAGIIVMIPLAISNPIESVLSLKDFDRNVRNDSNKKLNLSPNFGQSNKMII